MKFVDIEVDSGAELSCLLANIGVDTHPLHEIGSSMCGGGMFSKTPEPHVACCPIFVLEPHPFKMGQFCPS